MSTIRKLIKVLARVAVATVVLGLLSWIGVNVSAHAVHSYGDSLIHEDVTAVPPAPVAIVFGAGYSGGTLSLVLADRVHAGIALYQAGKVKKLLMTGDNGIVGYNEPDAMKTAAVAAGVPAGDILCDYAGFHTYDSLYRARDIFGVRRAVLVTQTYHLHRALYTGDKLGLDVTGLAAERHRYPEQAWFDRREVISCAAAWLEINVTHPRPKYLGRQEADLGK